MASIATSPLSGSTIVYNGVQWGGSEAAYKSLPPQYTIRGEFVYDEAERVVVGIDYTLTASAFFYEASETLLATNMDAMRDKLSAPGKTLTITGLGFVKTPKPDLNWGPKPLYAEWKFTGDQCAELVWAIKFRVSECSSAALKSGIWTAFNFDETWDNDFEGQTRKTTKGYVTISQVRKPTQKKAVVSVESVRATLNIAVPPGFKRISNSWPRNYANNRIDFTIVDEQLEGDPYPEGISLADGYCTFATNPQTMSKADLSIGMTLKVAPGAPAAAAAAVFFGAVAAKQQAMQTVVSQQFAEGTVIPYQMTITNRKYDGARITDASCRWTLTAGIGSVLTAAGIWEPLTEPDYNLWRASMTRLWNNRGNAELRSLPGDDVIMDACEDSNSDDLSNNAKPPGQQQLKPQFQFSCPEIPSDGGWVSYQPQVSQYRDDNITVHRRAVDSQVTYFNSDGQFGADQAAPFGGGNYTLPPEDDHVIERGGLPVVKVLLQFKGLRFKYAPIMPNLQSIGGAKLTLIKQFVPTPKWVADVFECPVFAINGWRLYQVTGLLKNAKPLGSKTSKSARKTIHVGNW